MVMNTTLTPTKGAAVTKSATTIINAVRLWVGTGGDVAVLMAADGPTGTPVTLKAVASGTMLEIMVCKVMSTNTTASNIVAFS